ncbi:MAG: hypothetical protein PHN75_16480, partial [Syntrophales bacterium]|nr:hypothetical protein [Syntrophales bacterium]
WDRTCYGQGSCADSRKPLLREAVIDAGLSVVIAVHPPPCARPEEPLHELGPADAEGILKILVRSGPVAVERYRKTLDAEFLHDKFLAQALTPDIILFSLST